MNWLSQKVACSLSILGGFLARGNSQLYRLDRPGASILLAADKEGTWCGCVTLGLESWLDDVGGGVEMTDRLGAFDAFALHFCIEN